MAKVNGSRNVRQKDTDRSDRPTAWERIGEA